MNAEEVVEVQRQVMGRGRAARGSVRALEQRVNQIWSNTERFTLEARRVDVSTALGEGRAQIETVIMDEAGGILERAQAQVERTLGGLRDVTQEELARSEMGLRAAVNAASQRPELLLNLYRERHLRLADRVLIEEAAQGMIDALGNSDNYEFRDAWNSLQQDLALARSPEELEALGYQATLDELASYLENAQTLVHADLSLMSPELPRADRERISVRRSFAEAEANRYETENAGLMEPGAAAA